MENLEKSKSNGGIAYLSNAGEYTTFLFHDKSITFLTGDLLERYTSVVEWDHGYLIVMCKNKNNDVLEEDYIDLVPILENLYIDVNAFLEPIKGVELAYA